MKSDNPFNKLAIWSKIFDTVFWNASLSDKVVSDKGQFGLCFVSTVWS